MGESPLLENECSHKKRALRENLIICQDCGLVLEEDNFTEIVDIDDSVERSRLWTELKDTKRVALVHVPIGNRILHDFCRNICMTLGLSESIIERVNSVIDVAVKEKLISCGRSGRRAVAVSIYLLAKTSENRNFISVKDLCNLVEEASSDFFKTLKKIKPLFKEVLSIDAFQYLNQSLLFYIEKQLQKALDIFAGIDRRNLLSLTQSLCEFCENESISVGRKPEPVVSACLLIVGEFLSKEILDRKKFKNAVVSFSSLIGCASETIIDRQSEILSSLHQWAIKCPLTSQVLKKRRFVTLYVEDIINYYAVFSDNSGKPPPSFFKAVAKRSDRVRQIEAAQQRIMKKANNSEALTLEDLIIERLLLLDVSVEEIQTATTLRQLLSIEERISEVHLSEQEDIDS